MQQWLTGHNVQQMMENCVLRLEIMNPYFQYNWEPLLSDFILNKFTESILNQNLFFIYLLIWFYQPRKWTLTLWRGAEPPGSKPPCSASLLDWLCCLLRSCRLWATPTTPAASAAWFAPRPWTAFPSPWTTTATSTASATTTSEHRPLLTVLPEAVVLTSPLKLILSLSPF